jgi:hypothetical protein
LIPVFNNVTFSVNPIAFGACYYSLSYSWTITNSKNEIVYKSTVAGPRYYFNKEDVYTVSVTVKTIAGGSCTANITKSTTSTLKVAKEGKNGVPA